jgi:hypothetical protein
MVVAILVVGQDAQHPLTHHPHELVVRQARIPSVFQMGGEPFREPDLVVELAKE